MNRVATIFEGPAIVVERFDHLECCAHRDEGSEITRSIAVTFVEKGDFELVEARKRWRFAQFDVLLSLPGIPRTYHHRLQYPTDVCLSLSYTVELIEEALGRLPNSPLPARVPAGTASRFALGRLLRSLASADAMAIESVAFDCALGMGPRAWLGARTSSGVAAHSRKIERACESMITRLAEHQSLSSTAAEAGMSTFHFARVFRELLGQSPHQYLLRA